MNKTVNIPALILASVVTALLISCSALQVQDQYAAADRATFEVVAPVVRNLADDDPANDPDLTGVNGQAVLLMLDSWELRLKAAEGGER